MAQSGPTLTERDRRFIRLLAPDYADEIESALSVRTAYWASMSGASGLPSRWRDLALWVRLVWRLLWRRRTVAGADVVCEEYAASVEAKRGSFFRHYLAGEKVDFVGAAALPTGSLRGAGAFKRIAGLLALLLSSRRGGPSELAPKYVHITEHCLAVYGRVQATRQKHAYLLRTYLAQTPILAGFLMQRGCRVTRIMGDGRLPLAQLRGPADEIVLTNPYQLYVVRSWSSDVRAKDISLWGPSETSRLMAAEKACRAELPHDIGVYTQGFWLRAQQPHVQPGLLRGASLQEEQLCDAITEYLDANPGLTAILFPHPLERRHQSLGGPAGRLAAHPRVVVHEGDGDSLGCFALADVGVTASTVGFDRLYMGHKTLLYWGEVKHPHRDIVSPFTGVIVSSRDALGPAIDRALEQTREEFILEHFGKPLSEWQVEDVLGSSELSGGHA